MLEIKYNCQNLRRKKSPNNGKYASKIELLIIRIWLRNLPRIFPVQSFSPVMSNSLRPRGLQNARPPSPSPTTRVYSNSSSLSLWCHRTISSSVIPFSSCLQSISASGSFQESALHIRWAKYCRFSFNISSSNEYSRLISFRMDW